MVRLVVGFVVIRYLVVCLSNSDSDLDSISNSAFDSDSRLYNIRRRSDIYMI